MANHIDHELIENLPHLKPYYDDKRLFYKNVFWIILSNALYTFGFGATGSLLAMHMANAKLGASEISSIFAITGWLAIPTILYISNLTDHWQWKWGRRLPFIAIAVPMLVITLICFPYAATFITCMALYLPFSLAAQTRASTYPLLNNDIAKKKYWGRITGVNDLLVGSIGGWLSIVILLPLVNSHSENTAFRASAFIIGIATALLLMFIREPPVRTDEKPIFNPVFVIWGTLKFGFSDIKNVPLFLAYAFCMNAGIPGTYIALQAKVNLHLTEGQVGTQILQYGLITIAVMSFFMGWAIDKLGTMKSLAIAYAGAVLAAALGVNPTASASLMSKWLGYQLSPTYALAGAYLIGITSYSLMATAASIFVMGSVRREQFARFCACSGSVNLFTQSFVMLGIGYLVTHVFNGNYGFSFIASVVLGLAGIMMFLVVNRQRRRSVHRMDKQIQTLENSSNEASIKRDDDGTIIKVVSET